MTDHCPGCGTDHHWLASPQLEGDLVRSAEDPAYRDAPLANNRKLTGTARVTVRAADYRKVR